MKAGLTIDTDTNARQFVTFLLADELYAIDIYNVHEVVEPLEVTHLPEMPAFIEGFIKLRGSAIPLIDLRKRFHLPEFSSDTQKLIIVEVDKNLFALKVDNVGKIIRVDNDKLKPPPEFTSHIGKEYLSAMGEAGDKFFIVLDIEKLFSKEEWDAIKPSH